MSHLLLYNKLFGGEMGLNLKLHIHSALCYVCVLVVDDFVSGHFQDFNPIVISPLVTKM